MKKDMTGTRDKRYERSKTKGKNVTNVNCNIMRLCRNLGSEEDLQTRVTRLAGQLLPSSHHHHEEQRMDPDIPDFGLITQPQPACL